MFSLITQKIETEDQKRKIILGTYLVVIYFIIDCFFFVVNLFNPEGIPWLFISGIGLSVIGLILLRKGFTDLSLFLFLARANALAYYFSSTETSDTGTFLYFLADALAPIAFYGYKDRWKGIAYSSVTFILFLVAEFKPDEFSPDQAHFYFITNFTFVLFTAGFIFLFFDRINRKAETAIIEKNKALEKANEELDRFVYHASHDLRAPLSSILGLTNIYNKEDKREEIDNIIQMIANRATKLDSFIKDILAYSQNARTNIKPEKVVLRTLIDECIDSIKYNMNFDSIQFEFEVDPSHSIVTDANRLKVIISNLLSNAVKYADKHKEKQFVKIKSEVLGESVKITIADNGIGIPEEFKEKVFEMFFRAHLQSEGSGLGLYIVKECVKKIGGQIEIQSKLGKGTSVTLSLTHL
ncbi:MAG TPA: hypothetical protein DGG95_06955 [Cytophagales bacterium]|jgi:signal transduction histidine kinase|nr:hypothetical protein [Cytophagales bacterium]